MIVLNLCCEREHLFEGWFASSDAFETQCRNGQVQCPVCGSTSIVRRPSAPYVNTGAPAPAKPTPAPREAGPSAEAVAAALVAALRRASRESEDVGERFAEEARRMHYGEEDARNIKGKATRDELSELLEEGIAVLPLPADDGELH